MRCVSSGHPCQRGNTPSLPLPLLLSLSLSQEGDVIELIERLDKYWFYARNADLEMTEGAVPARDLRIVKGLPGESTVSGFEEGPCAIATYTFQGRKSY